MWRFFCVDVVCTDDGANNFSLRSFVLMMTADGISYTTTMIAAGILYTSHVRATANVLTH
jgi:hypothetical protein